MNRQAQKIAARVASEINAASALAIDHITAKSERNPTWDLPTRTRTGVKVSAATATEEIETKQSGRREFGISVAVISKIDIDSDTDEADLHDELADDIADLFRFKRLDADDSTWSVIWVKTETNMAAAPEFIEESRLYVNEQTFTFRMLG